MYNTYNGWKLRGRSVGVGERGAFRNEYGDMMFHKSQTVRSASKRVTICRDRYGNIVSKEVQYF